MKLLSKGLAELEYRDHLQRDLARATVCRFLVAYISAEGMESINRPLLHRALRDPRSFGVSSLSCSCGYEPLLRLQGELEPYGLRLKYFMDPLIPEAEEPDRLALFHSKLVYLYLERERKSVVYIGSHNWTRRALGPEGPRNAEASIRLEFEWAPEHLDGTGTSLAAEVNRHLVDAWNLPACLPATTVNEATFQEWYERGCRRSPSMTLEEVAVVLAVRKDDGMAVSSLPWHGLTGRGIYLQALEEGEGQMLWRSKDRVLVMVWESRAALAAGQQPILLRCRITTSKAGPDSRLHGTNQSAAPVAGFEAIVFDESQLAGVQQSHHGARSSVSLWSGRSAEVYDFEFPTQRSDSSQVDSGVTPRYQFHLEVEQVVFAAEGSRPDEPELVWARETFAVAQSRESARYEELPGYQVNPETRAAILTCLQETLLIDPEKAKVLPVSEYDRDRVGKRLSAHPLHETFLGAAVEQRREEFYQKAEAGRLVADLDETRRERGREQSPALLGGPVSRVQRVFTMPWDDLRNLWAEKAKELRFRKRPGE